MNRRLIRGTGPVPCKVMLVGEAGGAEEHEEGRPFVGKAGMVLTAYLRAVGVRRQSVYIDNIYPYWPGPGNPDPSAVHLREGGRMMLDTLRRVRPRFVACLGRISSRWFLGDGFELKRDHGLAFEVERAGLGLVVVPCFHPAAGFYDSSAAALCQGDLRAFAEVVAGKREVWKERPHPTSELVTWPYAHSPGMVPKDGCSLDTEGSVEVPQMISWAESYGNFVAKVRPVPPLIPRKLTFHYSPHDLKVIRTMGVDTDSLDYDDTIVMAFDLMGGGQDSTDKNRFTPLGLSLKTLAYRELGVRMRDFVDLVRPHYNRLVAEWVDSLIEMDLPEKGEPGLKLEKGKWKIHTPRPPRSRFSAVLLEASTGGQPEKKWGDLPEAYQKLGEERMGRSFPHISTAIELVPEAEAVNYAGADAWATRELSIRYRKRLNERGLSQVYEIDRRALPFVDEIVRNGLPIDMGETRRLKEELEQKTSRITRSTRKITGRSTFNPGSRDDVAWFLYEKLGLQAPRQTEGEQDSTDEKSVKILRSEVGLAKKKSDVVIFLDELLEYREAKKYIGTYVDWMIEKAKEDPLGWRLYPDDISTTRVVSGRLAGRLLTFPTRTDLGLSIRKCFVARPGWKILSVDLSQIELRIMAELSQDPTMLRAFEKGEDLHALTARRLFRLSPDEDVPNRLRYIAKTLNFAILYGITAKSLLEQLIVAGIYDYSLSDCERFIEEWFRLFPRVKLYLRRLWHEAEKTGEVRDWAGRLRYVPNIRLPEGSLKEKARRDVGNFPIQAGARELVKIAEADMMPWLRRIRELVLAILDIHDEVLFEVDEDVVEEVGETVRGYMVGEGRRRFGVPIEAGVGWGRSWGEAK